jgi:flavin reductase (DIM6/NTAB) family NADH-FMN oxidoreductase RutF
LDVPEVPVDLTAASTLIAWLDRELWLVTAQDGTRRSGLIATFVNAASIVAELPRMLVSLSRQHRTWELVQASGALALHLLNEQNLEWVWRFGLASGADHDKFAGLPVRQGQTGSPLLDDCVGWMDCRVETSLDVGDRTVYVVQVVESRVHNFATPLTTRRLGELGPADRVAEMKRQRHYDSLLDAEAIHAWRRQHGVDDPVLPDAGEP